MTRTFGSFCSGIGAPEKAWTPLGWRPMFFAEIEPFPCAVLAHHYPHVRNFGDMTTINTAQLPDADIWVAGTPCQAFSVAGLRKSLADDRGNLTLVFCRMIHERNPWGVVWENVPGVLNTKDNAFGCFLAGLVGEGQPLVSGRDGWADAGMVIGPRRSAAWRILDAQYFGLAQRRRRVFVVSFRTGDNINPAAVLLEPESLPRDSPPSRETGQRIAASLTRGADLGGKGGYAGRRREDDFNIVTNALDAHMGMGGPDDNAAQANHLIPFATAHVSPAIKSRDYKGPSSDGDGDGDGDGAILVPMLSHSLRADGFDASEDGTGRGTPLVPVAIQEDNQNGVTMRDTAGSLRSNAPGTQPCGTLAMVTIPIDMRQASRGATMTNNRSEDACSGGAPGTGIGEAGDPAPSVSQSHPPAVAFTIHGTNKTVRTASETDIAGSIRTKAPGSIENSSTTVALAFQTRFARNGRGAPEEVCPTLQGADAGATSDMRPCIATPAMAVRRLTPVECERLQGFPDRFTDVQFRGKPAADGPRYRALGNSMAVPVLEWIGRRIEKVIPARPSKPRRKRTGVSGVERSESDAALIVRRGIEHGGVK